MKLLLKFTLLALAVQAVGLQLSLKQVKKTGMAKDVSRPDDATDFTTTVNFGDTEVELSVDFIGGDVVVMLEDVKCFLADSYTEVFTEEDASFCVYYGSVPNSAYTINEGLGTYETVVNGDTVLVVEFADGDISFEFGDQAIALEGFTYGLYTTSTPAYSSLGLGPVRAERSSFKDRTFDEYFYYRDVTVLYPNFPEHDAEGATYDNFLVAMQKAGHIDKVRAVCVVLG